MAANSHAFLSLWGQVALFRKDGSPSLEFLVKELLDLSILRGILHSHGSLE